MIINFLRVLIGNPPTVPSTSAQWDYGRLLEYTMAVLVVLICVVLVFSILKLLFHKKGD